MPFLQMLLQTRTHVHPGKQKLIGLGKGKFTDETELNALTFNKAPFRFIFMGTPEARSSHEDLTYSVQGGVCLYLYHASRHTGLSLSGIGVCPKYIFYIISADILIAVHPWLDCRLCGVWVCRRRCSWTLLTRTTCPR